MLGEWFTGNVFRTLLLVIAISGLVIGIAVEGGGGIFALVGALSFVLYFVTSAMAGAMTMAAVWLLVIGIILIALEIFVIPGFGVVGLSGIAAVFAALVLAGGDPMSAVFSLLIALALSAGIIFFTLKNRRTRKLWQRMILTQRTDSASGYDSADPALARFQGKCGRSLTVLRPSGSALIDGEKVDVVTRGEYIEADRPIRVLLVEGVRVVVAEADAPDAAGSC